ncbi:MAG: cupin domain-containing protein [Atopobiaceae bacterium]|jgi:quercetin dioxygenase-like cupin family protein|nr:cupin domain-containing protein [Atopobiaceae bacterium]
MTMRAGEPFRLSEETEPLAGITISHPLVGRDAPASYFVLGAATDISEEVHPEAKLVVADEGALSLRSGGERRWELEAGEAMVVPAGMRIGMRAGETCVFRDVAWDGAERGEEMAGMEAGKAFRLQDLVPYREGSIVNRDLIANDKMKYVVMAFDEGCALSEHAAPGEALLTVLEGAATVTYEGVPHRLEAGESIRFESGGLHAVAAEGRFKMSLAVSLA